MTFMLVLRGAPALSDFRSDKLLQQLAAANLPVSGIYAEYVHFAELSESLLANEKQVLDKLLSYGPHTLEHQALGHLILVVPRPGTISPWSSKATDIAQIAVLIR